MRNAGQGGPREEIRLYSGGDTASSVSVDRFWLHKRNCKEPDKFSAGLIDASSIDNHAIDDDSVDAGRQNYRTGQPPHVQVDDHQSDNVDHTHQ